MRPPNSANLLQIWEDSFHLSLVQKSIYLLSFACNTDKKTIASWSIGQRDARLFLLRKYLFGAHFENLATCQKCNEQIEWNMSINDFPLPTLRDNQMVFDFQFEKYQLQFRLPNSQDLQAATIDNQTPSSLVQNCIINIHKAAKPLKKAALPSKLINALTQEMEKIDPLAHISMQLACPNCQHQWNSTFDIITYLWAEIDNWAKHLLQEIAILARHFSWSEQDILNMSPRRRQLYLAMIQQ